jgi:hypothetical protein
MLKLIVVAFSVTSLLAQSPAQPVTQPTTPPASATTQPIKPQPPTAVVPAMPPVVTQPPDPRKLMLKNLIQAGILMLEGKAYRQFIQAFVDDEDRRPSEVEARNYPLLQVHSLLGFRGDDRRFGYYGQLSRFLVFLCGEQFLKGSAPQSAQLRIVFADPFFLGHVTPPFRRAS